MFLCVDAVALGGPWSSVGGYPPSERVAGVQVPPAPRGPFIPHSTKSVWGMMRIVHAIYK